MSATCPRCGAGPSPTEHCTTLSGRDHAPRVRAERETRLADGRDLDPFAISGERETPPTEPLHQPYPHPAPGGDI